MHFTLELSGPVGVAPTFEGMLAAAVSSSIISVILKSTLSGAGEPKSPFCCVVFPGVCRSALTIALQRARGAVDPRSYEFGGNLRQIEGISRCVYIDIINFRPCRCLVLMVVTLSPDLRSHLNRSMGGVY